MEKTLNPIRNYQYTMWKHWQDHDEFHAQQFDRIFELCASCLEMVVEGPWEPVYSIVKAKMPPIRSMGQIADLGKDFVKLKGFIRFATPERCVAIAEHTVVPGREKAFEEGAIKTMDAMPSPPEYLIHSEWDTTEMAQVGFAKVLVNHNIRKIHDEGVMAHLIRGPYVMFFQPMMEEAGWRSYL